MNTAPDVTITFWDDLMVCSSEPRSYTDSWGITHEITRTQAVTDVFGKPRGERLTASLRCRGGLSLLSKHLVKGTEGVNCLGCLAAPL